MGEKEERRRRRWEGGRERGGEREDENTKERERDLTGKTEIYPRFMLCAFIQTKCLVSGIFKAITSIRLSLTRLRSL